MKKDYLSLWSILALAFAVFFTLSMCENPRIGAWNIKSSGMADAVLAAGTDAGGVTAAGDTVAADTGSEPHAEAAPAQMTIDPQGKNVLIIGDSMLEGLAPRLAAYCEASGANLYSVIWYSSTSELYGQAKLITDYIRSVHPDFIFISLGGNELFVRDIAQKRAADVRSIIAEVGDIPFLWIGPPNWKADTGINALVESTAPKGCFFLSDGMSFERKKDGAHPTAESAALWMDSVVRWMPAHARYYIEFNKPEKQSARATRQYIHQPGPLTSRPK